MNVVRMLVSDWPRPFVGKLDAPPVHCLSRRPCFVHHVRGCLGDSELIRWDGVDLCRLCCAILCCVQTNLNAPANEPITVGSRTVLLFSSNLTLQVSIPCVVFHPWLFINTNHLILPSAVKNSNSSDA